MFGIPPYKFVHELYRHGHTFTHFTFSVYFPRFHKKGFSLPGSIGNQRYTRMQHVVDFFGKFVRIHAVSK